ncbi:hypothetical protein A3718_05490 [Erythrobacter sp. HI0019]|nr:hypothetical protein A3718_05490 [Erythrobacter sp. HI0019]KZY10028.1 hypothetical protein A3723_08250 [Erythrobacter sp. HI0028]
MIDPAGHQIEPICCALTNLEQTAKTTEEARRDVHSIARFLSGATSETADPIALMLKDWKGFREVCSLGFASFGVHSQDRGGVVWVKPPVDLYPFIKTAVAALGRLASILANHIYEGIDPSARLAVPIQDKYDVGNLFRVAAPTRGAPRIEDPRFWSRWCTALHATGADEALILAGHIARFGGPRAFQVLEATLWDLFVSPKAGRTLLVGRKGNRSKHDLPVKLPKSVWKQLISYIDCERRRRTGYSLEDLKALSADAEGRKLLKNMPLLTECGRDPITYDRLYKVYRKAAEFADLYFEDEEYLETGVRRYVTFHFLRHEFVHEGLDRIIARPAAARAAEYEKLRNRMGWSHNSGMIDWYSRHHQIKVGAIGAAEHADFLDARHGGEIDDDDLWGLD